MKEGVSELPLAYGGVLIDSACRVLLRKPTNHFGGYVWSFAKGGAKPGETPEQTALREVLEETGYDAEILYALAGEFVGETSVTRFYLMRPNKLVQKPGWETVEVCWVSQSEADALIQQTTSEVGQRRDLAVLAAAFSVWEAGWPHARSAPSGGCRI